MKFPKGMLVEITAGKYKGLVMTVVDTDGISVFVADGRHRKLEKTKKLNPKHIKVLEGLLSPEDLKLLENGMLTNRALWKILVTNVRLDRKD